MRGIETKPIPAMIPDTRIIQAPADLEDWPEAGYQLACYLMRDIPGLTFEQLRALIERLLRDPDRQLVWTPSEGQTPEEVLGWEALILSMLLQVWVARVQQVVWADDPIDLHNLPVALQVISAALGRAERTLQAVKRMWGQKP